MKTRIYVCGSHSVGKTTLCRELGKHLNYEVVGEAARDVINENKVDFHAIARDVAAKDEFQLEVMKRHFDNHDRALHTLMDGKAEGYVFDRGIDYAIYAAEFSTKAHLLPGWPAHQEYVQSLKDPGSLTVLLEPHEKLLKQDDVRASLDMLTAQKITFGIKCLLEIYGIPYIYITNPDTMERVKLIANIAE